MKWPGSQPTHCIHFKQGSHSPDVFDLWISLLLVLYTLRPGYFEFFKNKEFPRYMWELKISELDISKKKLNIDGHLVSTLGGCGGFERTDFNSFYIGRVW